MTTTDDTSSDDLATDTEDAPESYAAALTELDAILLELEDDALDVDILAERVERASVLIRFCRTRITTARTQVSNIVADLDALGVDA